MSTLRRGHIVLADVPDPQGRNPKVRPLVVVSPDDEIAAGGQVLCVAISRQYQDVPAGQRVELPWDRNKHPRTGLRAPCAAIPAWLQPVQPESIIRCEGRVPDPLMIRILALVAPPGPLPLLPPPADA